jgi:zinc transport system substrate-binding protein
VKRWSLILAGVAGFVVLGVLYVRTVRAPVQPSLGKLRVAATIYPLYDIARNVVGDEGEVAVIVPPDASPHLFEFSPRQLEALQDVRAVFAIGHGLDNWVTRATNVTPGAQVIVVDQGIDLRKFPDGTTDPHYWLNFGNARKIADNIANELIRIDPAHADIYRKNAETYAEKLTEKERELKEVLAPVRGLPILTFHDAWYYFAENFELNIVGTFEPAAGEEPAPRYLAELHRKIETQHIRILFTEPQLSTGVVQSFAKDSGVGIAELDPLGGVEGRTTYLELMEFNADSIRRALQERGS